MLKRLIPFLLLATAWGQVVPGSGSSSGPTSGIIGQIQTATGGVIKNGTLTFSLSQSAVVAGSATIATQQTACYTSTSGNIVGVPDALALPVTSVNLASGTLPAGNYFVQLYYLGAGGNSMPSPEVQVNLSSQGTLNVNAPVLQPGSATGYAVAIGSTSGSETVQFVVTGFTQYQQSTPLVAGGPLPVVNDSACSIYFSDQLVPTGTYYTVNLLNRNGSKVAGYPQNWCTYGGPGGIINVSNGAPSGNCNTNGVFYPTPIFANPQNGGIQSISGPLSLPAGIIGPLNVSGTVTFTGVFLCHSMNGVRCVDAVNSAGWAGPDFGSWVNSAVADLPATGGEIEVAQGAYTNATAPDLTGGKNIYLHGAGRGNTVVTWTGGATPMMLMGGSTGGMQTVTGFTLKGSGGTVPGQNGVYIHNSNNPSSFEGNEITQVGDVPILIDGSTALTDISFNYVHLNLASYCIQVNSASAQNVVLHRDTCYNNKGGINISAAAAGVTIQDTDSESGLGTASLPMLNIANGSTGNVSIHGTYGYGPNTTGTDVATVAANGFHSISDVFSIGKTGQNALHLTTTAANVKLDEPAISGIGTGVGNGLLIDAGASDNVVELPRFFNSLAVNLSDAGTRTSVKSDTVATSKISNLGPLTQTGQITTTVATGTAPFAVSSTTPVATMVVANHPLVQGCGTTSTCAAAATTGAQIVIGSAPLVSGTPSTVTVTGISPAFTSTSTFRCTVTNATNAANNLLKVVNTSASSITITGPNTLTDTINYICVGN